MKDDDDETVTVNGAAARLRCTPQHVRRLAKNGGLTSRRTTPRKTMITVASIEALENENNSNKQQ